MRWTQSAASTSPAVPFGLVPAAACDISVQRLTNRLMYFLGIDSGADFYLSDCTRQHKMHRALQRLLILREPRDETLSIQSAGRRSRPVHMDERPHAYRGIGLQL